MISTGKPGENVPKGFGLLYKHATGYMTVTRESVQLPCDAQMFGDEKTIFVLQENLLALLQYKIIGQAVLSAYMLYVFFLIFSHFSF